MTALVWVAVTLLTAPEPAEKLEEFYRRVRPAGPGWRRAARAANIPEGPAEVAANLLNWALGVGLVYAALFATGGLVFGRWARAALFGLAAALCGGLLLWNLNRTGHFAPARGDE